MITTAYKGRLALLGAGAAIGLAGVSGCRSNDYTQREVNILKYDHPTQPTTEAVTLTKKLHRSTLPLPLGATSGTVDTFFHRPDTQVEFQGETFFPSDNNWRETIWLVSSDGKLVSSFPKSETK